MGVEILGSRTEFVETTGSQKRQTDESSSEGKAPQRVDLMTTDAVRAMDGDDVIVIQANARGEARHPMRLRKVRYFEDARFAGLYDDIAPPGAL